MPLGVGVRVGPFYAFGSGRQIAKAALAWWILPFWGMWMILKFYWWLLVNLVMMIVWVATVAVPAVAAFCRRRFADEPPADTPPGPRDWTPPEEPESAPGAESRTGPAARSR